MVARRDPDRARPRSMHVAAMDGRSSHCDRLVEGDELAAVGEGRLDLDVGEHLGDAVHHLVPGQHLAAADHQVGDPAPSRARSITQVLSSATDSG